MNKTVDFRADVLSFRQLILQFFFSFPYNVQTCHCNIGILGILYSILYVNPYLGWLIAVNITARECLIELYLCLQRWLQNFTSSDEIYIRSSCIVNTIIGAPECIYMNHECISIVCATAIDRDYRVRSCIIYIYYNIPIANINYII